MSWQAASFAILAVVLAGAFLWYERQRPPARVLALVAALAALAVVGRLAFAAIPNVKPTTDIVLFAGYALGGVPGFVVGAVTALVSNIFLSQGPWTAWQMVGWGAVGAGGALLATLTRGRELGRLRLALVCGLAGFAFGAWMDMYQWTLAARQDLPTYLAISGTSLPYNAAHAVGNVVFCLLIGPAFVRALARYRRRFEVSWAPRATHAGAAAAVVLALALATGASVGSAPAAAADATATTSTASSTPTGSSLGAAGTTGSAARSPAARATAYLLAAQNADGGFGGAPKQSSTELHSGWAALGLAAAGRNPRDLKRRGGRTLAAYVKRGASRLSDLGETERTALVVDATGLAPHSFAGHDLAQEIADQRRPDGSIAGQVSYTAFGMLALRAAGDPPGASTVAWLLASQNEDGGYGLVRGATSDADMTGVALEALAVAGRSGSAQAQKAVAYLRGVQGADGGFSQRTGDSSNAQSTAYAVQGLVAVGGADDVVSRANGYLVGLQRSDGSIAYSSTSRQTPVWVTAQALMALRRAPLPVAAAPRAPKKHKRKKKPKAAAKETIGGGAAGPTGSGGSAGSSTPAPSVTPTPAPASATPGPLAGSGGSAAPTPTPAITTPLSVPTPDANPADAASAQRAAAGAGDAGVGPGEAIGVGLAILAALGLLWLSRRRLLAAARRGGMLMPARLRRSS